MTLLTIALDPGRTSGVSAWEDGELVYATKFDMESCTPAMVTTALLQVLQLSGYEGGDGLAEVDAWFHTERLFLARSKEYPKGDPRRVPALVSQLRVVCYWEAVAHLVGLRIGDRIVPATWQSRFSLIGKQPDGSRKNTKAGSRLLVTKHCPQYRSSGHDVSDAILLGLHCHLERRVASTPPAGLAAHWRPKR